MDGAVVEPRVILRTGVSSHSATSKRETIFGGSPAKQIRRLNARELEFFEYSAKHYAKIEGTALQPRRPFEPLYPFVLDLLQIYCGAILLY